MSSKAWVTVLVGAACLAGCEPRPQAPDPAPAAAAPVASAEPTPAAPLVRRRPDESPPAAAPTPEPAADGGQLVPTTRASAPAGNLRPELRATAERLRALGFERIDPDRLAIEDQEYTDAAALLELAGYAHWFDVETGTFPNEHDALLRSLAALVRPALDGVVFEEVAPVDDVGGYLLRARVDGFVLETDAENLGDWYDVDAVLRLLDAVLLERRSDQRFAVLAAVDQTATIVGARGELLQAAFAAGVLEPGDPDTAASIGKDFEQRVRATLDGRTVR